jgi:hypothetical protein
MLEVGGDTTMLIDQPYKMIPTASPVVFPSESPGSPSPSAPVTIVNDGIVPLVIGQAAIVGFLTATSSHSPATAARTRRSRRTAVA